MAAIQPKNTTDIKVDKIYEKTSSAGLSLMNTVKVDTMNELNAGQGIDCNGLLTIKTTGLTPLISTGDLGTSTAGEHFRTLFAKNVHCHDSIMEIGTNTDDDLEIKANNVNCLILKGAAATSTPARRLQARLGDTGFTSGGELEFFTANCTTTSTSPTTLMTYTIPQTNTQVNFLIFLETRDNTAGTGSFILISAPASRAGGGAVAGTVGSATATSGTALGTVTLNASGNDIEIRCQNVSGTNTTYHRALILAIPVSTST